MDFVKKITEISKKVGGVAEKTFVAAKNKSGQIIEETKIKIKIVEKENEIKDMFTEMGTTLYDMYKNEKKIEKEFVKNCKKIEKLNEEILDMEEKELNLADFKKCDKCSKKININDQYCSNCGTKQKEVKQKNEGKKEEVKTNKQNKDEVEEKKITKACKKCGKILPTDFKYCSKCGYKF